MRRCLGNTIFFKLRPRLPDSDFIKVVYTISYYLVFKWSNDYLIYWKHHQHLRDEHMFGKLRAILIAQH